MKSCSSKLFISLSFSLPLFHWRIDTGVDFFPSWREGIYVSFCFCLLSPQESGVWEFFLLAHTHRQAADVGCIVLFFLSVSPFFQHSYLTLSFPFEFLSFLFPSYSSFTSFLPFVYVWSAYKNTHLIWNPMVFLFWRNYWEICLNYPP